MRILYSFPHVYGGPGDGAIAAKQVAGLAALGCEVTVFADSAPGRMPTGNARTHFTRSIAAFLRSGQQALTAHDRKVADHLRRNPSAYDLVHCWPGASLQTLRAASQLGLPGLLEVRTNHAASKQGLLTNLYRSLEIDLARVDPDWATADWVSRQVAEYEAASHLLVSSDHMRATFAAAGVPEHRLLGHQYGFDPTVFQPVGDRAKGPLRAVFIGDIDPRNGPHIALEAWRQARGYRLGCFSLYGEVTDSYRATLGRYTMSPNVDFHKPATDLPAVLRDADVIVVPTLDDAAALSTYAAQGSGVVPVVSDAAGAICTDGVSGLVHRAGDIPALVTQLQMLLTTPAAVSKLRDGVLAQRSQLTWAAAATRLDASYREALTSTATRP